MNIDRNKIYQINDYTYKNFVGLTLEEVKLVWEWRNHEDIRKWMITKDIIPFENIVLLYVICQKGMMHIIGYFIGIIYQ